MTSDERAGGIVYILSNRYMPGVLKIGRTVAGRGQRRVEELFTTGVPVPFNVEYAAYVADAAWTEKQIHAALKEHRTHRDREFFEVDPETAKQALAPWDQGDATPELLADRRYLQIDLIDAAERTPAGNRRRNMDFFAMGLQSGDALYESDSGRWAYVEDRHTVYFEGQHGQSLNGVYQWIHGKRKPGSWRTEGGHRVRWLFDHVQHGNERPPWERRAEA